MALGVYGFGCEDALTHLMNYVWPNVFETAPHMMQSFHDASDGFRVSVGPIRVLQYALQVGERERKGKIIEGGREETYSRWGVIGHIQGRVVQDSHFIVNCVLVYTQLMY